MIKNKHIAAFTEVGTTVYPAYISINLEDGVYVIRMRSRGIIEGSKLEIPAFDLARVCRQIEDNIGFDVHDITAELDAEIVKTELPK